MSLAGVHRLRGLLLLGLVANHRGALWVAEVTRKGGSATEATEAEGVCDFNTEIPTTNGFRFLFIYCPSPRKLSSL